MKIFISSLIGGFEPYRAAARSAILNLRHEPVMAEDFGARANSPQVACLQAVRSADVVVLILGERYGSPQGSSGVSPTHEEYLAARGAKPILMFTQDSGEREDAQAKFIAEVGAWQSGHFRAAFSTPDELKDLVTRAIHDYQLSTAAGPLDVKALADRALAMLPDSRQGRQSTEAAIHVAVAGGPAARLLRPAALEAPALADDLHKQALFGKPSLFVGSKGVEKAMDGSDLVVKQERGARIQLDESGALLMRLPLSREEAGRRDGFGMAIDEDDVLRELGAAVAFASWVLDRIDPTEAITHVALAASIESSDYMAWRSLAERDASHRTGVMRMATRSGIGQASTHIDRPRPALRFQASEIAEDLMVALRRLMKS